MGEATDAEKGRAVLRYVRDALRKSGNMMAANDLNRAVQTDSYEAMEKFYAELTSGSNGLFLRDALGLGPGSG